MRRSISGFCFLLTVSLMAGLVSGCARHTPPQVDTLRVGVALYRQDDTFISSLAHDLERQVQQRETADNRKINLNIMDGRSSQLIQNEQIERLIALDYDVLFVNIVDRTAAAALIDQAREADVPIIFFNRQPVSEDITRWEQVYYVGAQAEQSGIIQGQIALDQWNMRQEEIDRNGDGVLQYVMLEGEPGHQDALIRTEYSIKTVQQAGVAVEKLVSDTANWSRDQAAAKMAQWLDEFGGDIEVVFSNNDDMALGAIDAYLEAGTDPQALPLIVGVDATEPALEAVRAGRLCGTALNDAAGMAGVMLELTLALADGREPGQAVALEEGHYVWLPYARITREELLPETHT